MVDDSIPPGPPPAAPSTPAIETSAPPTATGLPPAVAAGLACLFPLLGGLIFLVLEKTNSYVRFYALQSVFLTGGVIALNLVVALVAWILGYVPILGGIMVILMGLLRFLLSIGWLVLWVVLVVKAFSGVEWEIPIIGPMVREQLSKNPRLASDERIPGP